MTDIDDVCDVINDEFDAIVVANYAIHSQPSVGWGITVHDALLSFSRIKAGIENQTGGVFGVVVDGTGENVP